MALLQSILDTLKTEIKNYLGATLADFYVLPGHRMMVYACLFIFAGMGVFGALTVVDYNDQLLTVPLTFMGIHAWHVAANFTCCTILVDMAAAALIRPWGAYDQRTVGKAWIIFAAGFLVGFLSERTLAYRLIVFYEPNLYYAWEYGAAQRAGVVSMLLLAAPFWFVTTAVIMRIITSKQAHTENLLRVRVDTLLEERARRRSTSASAHPMPAVNDAPVPLPMDPGVGPIRPSQIDHVTVEDHYLRIFYETADVRKETLVRLPLKKLISLLPDNQFVQIHRSHIVNLKWVSGVKRTGRQSYVKTTRTNMDLPVSRYRLQHLLPLMDRFLNTMART